MRPQKPGKGCAEIVERDGALVISTSKRNWIAAGFALLVLGFMTFVVLKVVVGGPSDAQTAIDATATPVEPDSEQTAGVVGLIALFMVLFAVLALWLWALSVVLWYLIGREEVVVGTRGIQITRRAFPLRRRRFYEAAHIADLRSRVIDPDLRYNQSANVIWRSFKAGSLCFDYGRATFGFGLDLEEADAKHILSVLRERFPQYV